MMTTISITEERRSYATQIVLGMQHLHGQNIVHIPGQIENAVIEICDFSHISIMKDTCKSAVTDDQMKGSISV